MHSDPQNLSDYNHNMFQDFSLKNELHHIESPEMQMLGLNQTENGSFDQTIQKDENDDSKSEIYQETLQNTGFRKIPELIVELPIQKKQVKNNHSKTKKNQIKSHKKSKVISKGKQGCKKDYKKNICGYITRHVLKQSLCTQYQQNIEKLCRELKVPTYYFYKIYRAHNSQSITGPTHFYKLVSPRMVGYDLEENIKELSTRMVFLIFFQWFVRNRYIRYLMGDGKMTQKDKYLNYKNREMMCLIVLEWKEALERARNALKEQFESVESVMNKFDEIYIEMTEQYRMQPKQQKEHQKEQNREKRQIEMTQVEIQVESCSKSQAESPEQMGFKFEKIRM